MIDVNLAELLSWYNGRRLGNVWILEEYTLEASNVAWYRESMESSVLYALDKYGISKSLRFQVLVDSSTSC